MSDAERLALSGFGASLGLEITVVEPGEVAVVARPGEEHRNGGGIVHGGYLSAVLDVATGWAVHSRLEDQDVVAPHTSLSVQYVRAVLPGQELRGTARCARAGRRTASAEAELLAADALVAKALSTHAVIERGSPSVS